VTSSRALVPATRQRWGLIAVAGALLAVAAIAVESSFLQTMSRHGTSVFTWELVGSSSRADTVLTRWGATGRSAAVTASWIDFAFILGYTMILFGLSRALASRARGRGVIGGAILAETTAGVALAAGAANTVAKILQLVILGWNTGQPLPGIGFAAAVLNYLLLLGAIVGCMALLLLNRRRPLGRTDIPSGVS